VLEVEPWQLHFIAFLLFANKMVFFNTTTLGNVLCRDWFE
jgi:hypothetical protein